jgi:uncharacterized protein (DUF924 family)
MTPDQHYFCYMPYMHSESLLIHDEAPHLFQTLSHGEALRYIQPPRIAPIKVIVTTQYPPLTRI